MVNNGWLIIAGWWFGIYEFYDFPCMGNNALPTDFHIFQRVQTTNQIDRIVVRNY
jgi:hypothetical protein